MSSTTANGIPYVSGTDTLTSWPTTSQTLANKVEAAYASERRLAFQTRTTTYTVDQTVVGSAADVFSSDLTWTADGTSAYRIEFYCPRIISNTGYSVLFELVNGTGTQLGMMGLQQAGSSTDNGSLFTKIWYTPSAGTVTVNARAIKDGGANTSLYCGTGGTGAYDGFAMWMAVYGPQLT